VAFIKRTPVEVIEPPRQKEPSGHDKLVMRGERWLKAMNCKVVLRDPFQCLSNTGEQPDVIGWKSGVSILIEVKTSRSDFLADAKKPFRQDPSQGMGDWRFYLCPKGVIEIEDLPEGWGLLWVDGRSVVEVHGVPTNVYLSSAKPFAGNRHVETDMLVSALRRQAMKGRLDEIYAD